MQPHTRAFRKRYAEQMAPAGYDGRRHVLLVAAAGLSMLTVAATQLSLADLRHWGWLILPTLVLANLVEYLVHRHVMHKPVPGLGAMYERHARRHHRYFTVTDASVQDWQDMHATLFPPVLLGFFSAVALSLSALVGLLLERPAGTLFFISTLGYYLAYEVLHLCAHLPQPGRSAWLRRLGEHHRLHHAPNVMRSGNFNIVFPLCDWLFGTLRRSGRGAPAQDNQSLVPRRPGP